MSEKHTPGPWAVIAQSKMPESLRVLHVDGTEANARLIAAAPELLEACKAAWLVSPHNRDRQFTRDNQDFDAAQRLAAVIAKAEPKP